MASSSDQDVHDLRAFLKDHIVTIDMVAVIEHYEERIRRLEDAIAAAKEDRATDARMMADRLLGSRSHD